jgi:hypothetical protein
VQNTGGRWGTADSARGRCSPYSVPQGLPSGGMSSGDSTREPLPAKRMGAEPSGVLRRVPDPTYGRQPAPHQVIKSSCSTRGVFSGS